MRTRITTTCMIGVADMLCGAWMNAKAAEAKPARLGSALVWLLGVCLLAAFLAGCMSLNPKRAGRHEKDRPAILASSRPIEAP